jgi:hypothetical protein
MHVSMAQNEPDGAQASPNALFTVVNPARPRLLVWRHDMRPANHVQLEPGDVAQGGGISFGPN